MIEGVKGSVTLIPILTMPNDDITHPVPDLTGYITEGQIVIDRGLSSKGVYPPINVLPSLSRLMKDGIGEGYTRADHEDVMNQLYESYSKVIDVRNIAQIVGEEDLSEIDKKYLEFGEVFENKFLAQGQNENRELEESLDLAWDILKILPRTELHRVSEKNLDKFIGKIDE